VLLFDDEVFPCLDALFALLYIFLEWDPLIWEF